MTQLIFGSPEANRIAAEIKFLERVERCPNCGQFAEMDRYSGTPGPDGEYGEELPSGFYFRLGCPKCRIQGDWRESRDEAALNWSAHIEFWWEINGERLNLHPPEEEDGL